MGYLLPARAYFRALETNETVSLGSVSLPSAIEIHAIRVLIYKQGTAGGTERWRIKAYRDATKTDLAYTSAYTNLTDITDLGTNWYGWVSASFSRENVPATTTFYLSLELENYTRNADTYYLALSLDWPNPQYAATAATRKGIALQIYGYEVIT
jgi:hypothetical protein